MKEISVGDEHQIVELTLPHGEAWYVACTLDGSIVAASCLKYEDYLEQLERSQLQLKLVNDDSALIS